MNAYRLVWYDSRKTEVPQEFIVMKHSQPTGVWTSITSRLTFEEVRTVFKGKATVAKIHERKV